MLKIGGGKVNLLLITNLQSEVTNEKIKCPMINYMEGFFQPRQFLIIVAVLIFSIATGKLRAQDTEPPFFQDATPADTIVNCIGDIPDAPSRMADDAVDGTFPKSITPEPDSPDPRTLACNGGLILRIWIAEDASGNIARDTQRITLLPDTDPPMVTLAERRDTINCEERNDPGMGFISWLDTRQLELFFGYEDCNFEDIDYEVGDNLPLDFDMICGTREVTFTVTDSCGQSTDWKAFYTVVDDVPPMLMGVPEDMTLECGDMMPDMPTVTATDNCSDAPMVAFNEISTQLMDGSCNQYEYNVLRIWSATDACGNIARDTQRVTYVDDTPPTFDRPDNLTINCSEDATDLTLTGEPTNVVDNCGGPVDLNFEDRIVGDRNTFCYDIERSWRARDVCGNTTVTLQFIMVRDTVKPSFNAPPNITVDCSLGTDPSVTGEPSMITDNCDPAPTLTFIDTETAGSCANTPTINRLWRVTDACGNEEEMIQVITVTDEQAPVFISLPQSDTLDCDGTFNIDQAFQNWITNRAGAQAEDNCPGMVRWFLFNTGTNDSPVLPVADCNAASQILRKQTIDFIIEDECGNRDTAMATFAIRDVSAPVFLDCPSDTILATNPGDCTATYEFFPPPIEDECGAGMLNITRTDAAAITSQATPGNESDVPVDPLDFSIDVSDLLPINAFSEGTLKIILLEADAETAGEFFRVYDEDGQFLMNTDLTDGPCGNGETTIAVSTAQINRWAADGTVGIRLEPNIPQGQSGRFAINDICTNGEVQVELNFVGNRLDGLSLAYRLDDGPRQNLSGFDMTSLQLDPGTSLMTLYAIDCGGNIDSCSFRIQVADEEAPIADCPDDILVILGQDSCVSEVALPLPKGATDNCAVGDMILHQTPADTASARITFSYDPNLNDYLAEERPLVFTGVAATAISDVNLRLDLKGDFNSTGAFWEIYGEGDTFLGSTSIGVAACDAPGQANFTISMTDYNLWAADGELSILAVPNDIPVPPGQAGDGINPCNPAAVNNNGDDDGESYMFGHLSYDALVPVAYYAEGASPIALSQMQAPAISPVHTFRVGDTDVSYIIEDKAGNRDTCSFKVTVEDRQAPVAICQSTRVFINPSGLQIDTVDAMVIDGGSTDNCMIDTMFINPSVFTCDEAGSVVPITLTVRDLAGNTNTCSTIVRVETLGPSPTANTGICGGDTLFLFTNPPPATGGVVYTYRWTGPGGFTSTLENPVIPTVDAGNEGSYMVEVTGITGCTAIGTVEVSIKDLPLTPFIETDQQVCVGDDIILNSGVVASGANPKYYWYEGLPPMGSLLGTTNVPTFTIAGPHSLPQGSLSGVKNFYLVIESDDCLSSESTPTPVTISEKPIAAVNEAQIEVCEGESVSLGTPITGEGITYEWSGPNNFASTRQFPTAITGVTPADGGLYQLVVFRNGCPSDPAFVNLTVLPKPTTPLIFNNGPVCEGGAITLSTNVNNASAYHWISSDQPEEILTNSPTLALTNLQKRDEANWRVFVTQFGCNSDLSAATSIEVNSIPEAAAAADPMGVCEGQSLRFFGLPNIVNANYTWEGPDNFSSSMQNPLINEAQEDQAGRYILTVETPAGCIGKDTIDIEVQEASFITGISNNAPSCLNGPTDITLVASVFPVDDGSYDYIWTTPSGGSLPNRSTVTVRNATSAQNGTYTLIVINDNGCTSPPKTMELQVADPPQTPPIPTPNTTAPFCAGDPLTLMTTPYQGGEVEYLWNTPQGEITTSEPMLDLGSVEQTDNGNYSVIAKVNGCESGRSNAFNLRVNPVPIIAAAHNGPVCSGSVINFSATEIQGASYAWVGPGFTSSLRNPRISQADSTLHAGVYKVVANLNGCFSNIDTFELVVKPKPERPLATNGGPVCIGTEGAALLLNVDENSLLEGASYNWFDPTGEAVGSSLEQTFTLTNLDDFSDGVFPFSVEVELNGCKSNKSIPTNVQMNTIPNTSAYAGLDTTICEADEFLLGASDPMVGSGEWSFTSEVPTGLTIDFPDKSNSTLSGLNGEINFGLRWTLSNGACVAYDSDEVLINVLGIETPNAGVDQLACASETITLDASEALRGMGEWSQSETQALLGVEIIDISNPKSAVQGLEPGNLYSFNWSIIDGCGNLEDEVLILISDPNPDAGQDSIVCDDNAMAQLNAAEPTEGSVGQWSSPNPELVISNVKNRKATVMDLMLGENVLVWTIDEGICGDLSRDTVIISYKENPSAQPDEVIVPFGVPTEFGVLGNDFAPPGSEVAVINGPSNGTVEQIEPGIFIYTPDFNYVGTDELTYELCSEGCECAESTVTFAVGADARCEIPSIITPNGDKVNDVFVIPCLFDTMMFPNSQVIVINQWGDEVFRSDVPYANNWNGTFNGEDLPVGTYFYLVEFGNGDEAETGYLMIHR